MQPGLNSARYFAGGILLFFLVSSCGGPSEPSEIAVRSTGRPVMSSDTSLLPIPIASILKEMTIKEAAKIITDAKGSPVLLHVYGSWCPPCRFEFPTIIEVASRYKAKGLKVVAIALYDNRPDLESMLSEYMLPFPPILITEESDDVTYAEMKKLGVRFEGKFPFTAIFDRKGRVVTEWKGVGSMEEFDKVITPLL